MAEPSPELIKALNNIRDEFMRLHAAFYAGTLGEVEQAELAKHCNDMIEQTSKIGQGTVRPPSQQVYVEADAEENTYIKSIRSAGQMNKDFNFNRVIKDPFAIKGKILKEGEK